MRTSFDPLGFVEAAYRLDLGEEEWLSALSRAAMPGMDQGLGVGAVRWQLVQGGMEVLCVRGEMDEEVLALVPRTYEGLPAALVAQYFSGPAKVLRLSDDPVALAFAMSRIQGVRQISDVIGTQVGDGRGAGLTIGCFSTSRARFGPARQRSWMRLMTHAGAALRLRTKLAAGPLRPVAVLDPNGRVQHAEGELENEAPRATLVRAVRAIERARGRLRRTSPEEALAAWRALVDGRWSVVDWIDVDGRRYLVAHENTLSPIGHRALAPREREVAEYLVHGRSGSEIAYALGLSQAAVDTLARAVLRKLGHARRTDLAALFGTPPIAVRLDEEIIAVSPEPRSNSHWDRLPPALRDVVAMTIDGATNEAISRARGRSTRTIANQLARVYAMFGVRGRSELAALLGPIPSRNAPDST